MANMARDEFEADFVRRGLLRTHPAGSSDWGQVGSWSGGGRPEEHLTPSAVQGGSGVTSGPTRGEPNGS